MSTAPHDHRDAFEEVVRAVHRPLLRYLLRRTDPTTAADVLGEVLTVLWRRFDDVPDDAPLPWCYGVARRCLANARRGARRQDRLVARIVLLDPPVTAPVEADPPQVEQLRAALARLRPEDAELLRLWAWEELEPREIATVLGVSPNAASIRLYRAKRRLARLLGAGAPGKDAAPAGHDQDDRDLTEGGRR